jgi:hypothetical protein
MSAYPRPFDPADFPAIPEMVAPRPKEVAQELRARAPVYAQSALRVPGKPDAFVTKLWIQDPGGLQTPSQSFQNKDESANAPVDSGRHFHFIPGLDDVEMRWTVAHPEKLVRASFEIWASGITNAPIWTKQVQAEAAVQLIDGTDGKSSGTLPWSQVVIGGDAQRFPDSVPNVAFAPYQVRLTVESENGMITTAWTYFDVLVHSIRLEWGPAPLRPAGHIQGVLPIYQPLTDRDEHDLVAALHTEAIDPAGQVEIALRSTNAAYIHLQEWYMWRDMAFHRYEGRWGSGPRIPLLAKVSLKDIGGNEQTGARAKRALGPAKFLWDWKDKTEAQRRSDLAAAAPRALTFIMTALKYKENGADDPPDCLNAHAERGGKRGGTDRVIPDNNGGNLPFQVAAAATRRWAAVSEAATSGPYKGETGIIFQPSRMALDSYQLRVFLACGGHLATLDVAGTMQNLVQSHSGLPTAATGMITILRRIDAKYLRKSNATPRMNLNAISAEYALGGIKVVWTEQFWNEAEYKNLMAAAMAPDNAGESAAFARNSIYQKNARGRRNGLSNWTSNTPPTGTAPSVVKAQLANFDQWYGCPAGQTTAGASTAQFTLPGRELAEEPFYSDVVREYIEKDRTINSQKRAWKKFQTTNPGVPVDRLRVRFFNEVLTAAQRSKILPEIERRYKAAGWQGWEVLRDRHAEWAEKNYNYRTSKLVYLSDEMHIRKVLLDGFEGVTFFHYQHLFDTLNADGSLYARQCSIGGVAAISMIADLGLSGAYTVWDHPTNLQRQVLARQICTNRGTAAQGADGHTGGGHRDCTFKDGNSTAVHEFGHFLHLPHATPTGGTDEANMHDQGDLKCIMNYDPDALHLCGGCLLRLRGWGFFKRGAIEGFSNTTPSLAGMPPPPCSDNRVEGEISAFYTDWR